MKAAGPCRTKEGKRDRDRQTETQRFITKVTGLCRTKEGERQRRIERQRNKGLS